MLFFEMHPKKDQLIQLKFIVNLDPKLWFAPNALINYIFKKMIVLLMEEITGFTEHVHERELGQRMKEKKEVYDFLKGIVGTYLTSVAEEASADVLLKPEPSADVKVVNEDDADGDVPQLPENPTGKNTDPDDDEDEPKPAEVPQKGKPVTPGGPQDDF